MGASYIHKCNNCGYSVSTSGPWEFYRGKSGRRKLYGHPSSVSTEAKQYGIAGLSGKLYCIVCDKVLDLILVEFEHPSKESMDVWSGRCKPMSKYELPESVKCRKCGNTELLLEPFDNSNISCPRCNKGQLVGNMEWIS